MRYKKKEQLYELISKYPGDLDDLYDFHGCSYFSRRKIRKGIIELHRDGMIKINVRSKTPDEFTNVD